MNIANVLLVTGTGKTRRYDATTRRAAADRTRRRVLAAAHHLFTTRGYAETSVAQVARRARVSVDTVYAAVGRKPQLLLAVHDMALAGGPEPVPAEQRDYVRAVREAPDARGEDHDVRRGPRPPAADDRAADERPARGRHHRAGVPQGLAGHQRTPGREHAAVRRGPASHRRAPRRPDRPAGGRPGLVDEQPGVLRAPGRPGLHARRTTPSRSPTCGAGRCSAWRGEVLDHRLDGPVDVAGDPSPPRPRQPSGIRSTCPSPAHTEHVVT